MLKPFLFVSTAALLIVASASAPAAPPQTASGNSSRNASAVAKNAAGKSAPDGQAMAKAKQVYNIDCALCHGANGDGKTDVAKDMGLTLDDWTDPKTLANRQDDELFNIIRNGKEKMPSEAPGRATDAEVRNLILYIRGMSKNQPAPAAPAVPAASGESSQAPASPQR